MLQKLTNVPMFELGYILVLELSGHKWTESSSGTSVSWTWPNQTESGTQYTLTIC